tara:strand:+ start:135 stop:1226 length:1092 start_codon:yes stop_codon:yes gene_type:complete
MSVDAEKSSFGFDLVIIYFLIIIITGINGFIALTMLFILSELNFGRDPNNKHGVTSGNSRLGGLAITFSIIFGVIINLQIISNFNLENFKNELDSITFLSLIIGLIGLAEDFRQGYSSTTRLIIMFIIITIGLYFMPALIPYNLEVFQFLGLSDYKIFVYLFTSFMVCGFINAGNIADGANGLLASIFFAFFLIAYDIDNTIFNLSILTTLITFILFNVSTGRIFLGDFGAYGLSALVALKSLEIYSVNEVNVFFLASILIYPCFEIVRSLILRIYNNASILSPDNLHLHNFINNYLIKKGFKNNVSNSGTGLGIAFISSIIPLSLYFSGTNLHSELWEVIFIIQIIFLTAIYIFLQKKLMIR